MNIFQSSIQIISRMSVPTVLFRWLHTSPVMCKVSRPKLGKPKSGPSRMSGKLILQKIGIDLDKYTTDPLPFFKTGGRGEDGRCLSRRIGGGHKKKFRMVDFKRIGPKEGPPLEEQIVYTRYDPCRSAHIALVASGEHKRYIVASENMKSGDIIKTTAHIPRFAIRAHEGDAHPLGALPIGTIVHNVERLPNEGGRVARAAGTSAVIIRSTGDNVVVRMPSKRELCVSKECMATVGRVSNIDHGNKPIGSAKRSRWLGIRPKSGWWHRKTGYNGRKVRPIKPMKVITHAYPPEKEVYRFTP